MTQEFANEQWKDVPGYEGYYQVSDMGRVRSCPRSTVVDMTTYHSIRVGRTGYEVWNRSGKILKRLYEGNRVPYVRLYKEGKPRENIPVKSLVYNTFRNTNIPNRLILCKDGNLNNLKLSNLVPLPVKEPLKRCHYCKPVLCVETDVVFESIKNASEFASVSTSTMRSHIASGKPINGYTYIFYKLR